jgi:AcrR family transcriptional regulator
MSPTPARTARARAKASNKKPTGKSLADRLSLEDWTQKALELLMNEGVHAVKVNRLCEELKVTKGSFYWHFADIDDLMESITARWCALTKQELSQLSDLDRLPPTQRLHRMTTRLVDGRSSAVERAIREWARTDTRIAEAVTESDQFVFKLVRQALLELGFDARQARVRAGLLVYAGIGFAHGQHSLATPTSEDIDHLLEFIAHPPAPSP